MRTPRFLRPPAAHLLSAKDRTPLVAVRRRVSLLAGLGSVLLLAAAATMLVGGGQDELTLVNPGRPSAEAPALPGEDGRSIIDVACGPRFVGQPRYEIRFDDGTHATRVEAPAGESFEIRRDLPTGLPFPGPALRFTPRSDGSWRCLPVAP